MKLTRRRFLTISAALPFATPAQSQSWQGRALGAELSIQIRGARDDAQAILHQARKLIREVEAEFSLYDPNSALSQLNRSGQHRPSKLFTELMVQAMQLHHLTDGLFDPGIQANWRALAEGRPRPAHKPLSDITQSPDHIQLAPGQQLTFNGIAQGFATDLISDLLSQAGLTNTLVNIGEYRATGGPWRLALHDPTYGQLATRTLTQGAIATSSPGALSVGGQSHILHPTSPAIRPHWSTISVEARNATTADAVSTALTLAKPALIQKLADLHGISRITAISLSGDLSSFSA